MDAHTAECYINAYLPCAAWGGDPTVAARLRSSVVDAPQPRTVPDIGKFVRLALKELDATKHPVAAAVLQAVPCFKKSYQCCKQDEALGPIKLNIMLAHLLGLYDSATKKPQFGTKVMYYKAVHVALTSEQHDHAEFVARYENLQTLSFMEYVTRILPGYMPSEHACLKNKYRQSFYWERLPLMCDQLRATCSSWDEAEAFAARVLEKITRVKRKCTRHQAGPPSAFSRAEVLNALSCPWISQPRKEDFQILSQAYRAPAALIEALHTLIRAGPLPRNLAEVQVAYVRKHKAQSHLSWHMRTHWHLCAHCLVNRKTCNTEMKLDTITQSLKCSSCKNDLILSIDFMGRIINILSSNYVFCPVCAKIHKVEGSKFPGAKQCYCKVVNGVPSWPLPCNLSKACDCESKDAPPSIQRCVVCGDKNNLRYIERVDHMTGLMHCLSYCCKHSPDNKALEWCYNTKLVQAHETDR